METLSPLRAPRAVALLVLAAVGIIGGLLFYGSLHSEHRIDADGQVLEVTSRAETVADLLDEVGISLASGDEVEPGLTSGLDGPMDIEVRRASTVSVVVHGDSSQEVTGVLTTVGDALDAAEVTPSSEAVVTPSLDAPISEGETVHVTEPSVIEVLVDGRRELVRTNASVVSSVIEDADIEVSADDIVMPRLEAPVAASSGSIVIRRVTTSTEQVDKPITFSESRRETDGLDQGVTQVEVEGSEGLERETWRITFIDGEESEREIVGTEVIEEPTDRVVLVGTRRPPPPPAPTPSAPSTGSVPVSTWDRLAQCESGGDWSINTGNGYYGGLQFALSSWQGVGGSGYPHQASKAEQIRRAEMLLDIQGWGAWPACSRRIGLR